MAVTLTKAQGRVFAFMVQHIAAHGGVAPTYAEISAGLGMKSVGNIYRIIRGLEERGKIKRVKGQHRGYEILTDAPFVAGQQEAEHG